MKRKTPKPKVGVTEFNCELCNVVARITIRRPQLYDPTFLNHQCKNCGTVYFLRVRKAKAQEGKNHVQTDWKILVRGRVPSAAEQTNVVREMPKDSENNNPASSGPESQQ